MKKENYSPEDKFSLKTDADLLRSASEFAKIIKKEKKEKDVDSNK
jgi:hypothetical protein